MPGKRLVIVGYVAGALTLAEWLWNRRRVR